MRFIKCNICNCFHFDSEDCGNKYLITNLQLDPDPKIIYAKSMHGAAIKYADYFNKAYDNELLFGSGTFIKIEFKDQIKYFQVVAEETIVYNAVETTKNILI